MKKPTFLFAFALSALTSVGPAEAQSVEKQPDGSVTWQAGVDGATLEFNPDGSVKRIYSKYSQPVSIADRRGIQTATIIAEEKAKASIVRFLQQHVATSRIVNEFETTATTTTAANSGKSDTLSTVDQRAISTSLNQLTSSFSSGTLTGVVMLENGYDEKEREVWVVVGLSQKTMAAARGAQEMLSDSMRRDPQGSTTSTAPSSAPKSTIRRGNSDF